MTELKRPPRL